MSISLNAVTVEPGADGYILTLSGKPLRTPARNRLVAPSEAMAAAVAAEWRAQDGTPDPATMPMTGFLNAAIDRIAGHESAFAHSIVDIAQNDLLCYRAARPESLVTRQTQLWTPPLDWLAETHGLRLQTTDGLLPVSQPPVAIRTLANLLSQESACRLAGIQALASLTRSCVLAMALAARAIDFEAAWEAAMLDELYGLEQWGEDAEARARLDGLRADYDAALAWLALLEVERGQSV